MLRRRFNDDPRMSDIEILKAYEANTRDREIVRLEQSTGLEYDEYPVDMHTFLTDRYYMGYHGADLYPKLCDDLVELFAGNIYDTVILTGAIGWGKDFFTSFAIARMIYEVSCFRNPQGAYKLARDSFVVFKNFSINATKARKVLFAEIAVKLRRSPYFQEKFAHEPGVLSELRFPKHVRAEPGNSLETSAIGENIFGAAIDEANFMAVIEDSKQVGVGGTYDQADRLFKAVRRRMKSRFKEVGLRPGMLIALSSKQYPDDFTERKVADLKDDPKTFIRDYAEWETKPKSLYCGEMFKVEVNDEHGMSRILEGNEDPDTITGEVVEVPMEWKSDFDLDMEGAIRDIAGRSTLAISPFIMNRGKIYDAVVEDWAHPFSAEETTLQDGARLLTELLCVKDKEGNWKPRRNPQATRAIHLDPGVSGDAFGFGMGHIERYEMRQRTTQVEDVDEDGKRYPKIRVHSERLPLINVDLMLRIVPPKGGEIQFNDVRSLIYELTRLGFLIGVVSIDSFQSKDTMQVLEKRGYHVAYVSVDADIEPYKRAKTALYDDRVNMYWYDRLIEELKRLEKRVKGGKEYVDHPPNFSKDVADAFAGMIYDLETMEIQPVVGPELGELEGEEETAEGVRLSEDEYRWLYNEDPPKRNK